ncbi:hypothetical protein [Desulfobulbus propionicus]|jgi:hypothetical protein
MTQQKSFTQVENALLPKFRNTLNQARSTEDVKKMFNYCMRDLFRDVSDGKLEVGMEDIFLKPETETYQISESFRNLDAFVQAWTDSDLSRIVGRFAEICLHQYAHLAKNPEKTEAKIRR